MAGGRLMPAAETPVPVDASAPERMTGASVELPDSLLARLGAVCEINVELDDRHAVARDWWPLAMVWAHQGMVARRPDVVARPTTPEQVSAVLALCDDARVPVTTIAGRSGVCGGAIAASGGLALDVTGLAGLRSVSVEDMTIDVAAGTFGHDLEADLRELHGVTLGHWPQSIELSTVGGWLACRSAGQMSTRYGKIEDMVAGLDVVLADGRVIHTDNGPRAAVGPDLTQLFVGSEGTLGVITGARLRVHPVPPATRRDAWMFDSFPAGLAACRTIVQRGATPAVLRLYDLAETKRNFDLDGTLLAAYDEGDPGLVDAVMAVVADECRAAQLLGPDPVERWFAHRNDVSALGALISKGYVVDTMEVAAPWSRLAGLFESVVAALAAVPHTIAASCHQSHAYTDGACLYFTFAGSPPADKAEAYYHQMWDTGTRTTLTGGARLSHHHGVGLNRARFMPDALGPAFAVLEDLKRTLDPNNILNPGKLGLGPR